MPSTTHSVVSSHAMPASSNPMVASNTIPHAAHRLPVHAARRTSMMSMSMSRTVSSRPLSLRHHGAPRSIRSIARCTAPARALDSAPTGLAREDVGVEAVEGAWACAVDEGGVAEEGNVVEAEVPDGGVDHAVGREGHYGTDDGAGEDVVPVVVLVNGECAANSTLRERVRRWQSASTWRDGSWRRPSALR